MAIKLWSALRKDYYRVHFDYDPSTGDGQECSFVHDVATNGFRVASLGSEIPVDQLPSKSFMLFPRIIGSFNPNYTSSRILYVGLVLLTILRPFGKVLVKPIKSTSREGTQSCLRREPSAQSSLVMAKHQGEWPAP